MRSGRVQVCGAACEARHVQVSGDLTLRAWRRGRPGTARPRNPEARPLASAYFFGASNEEP